MFRVFRSAGVPAALGCLACVALVLTVTRTPMVWSDEILYTSIARALLLRGDGVPTVFDGLPRADHIDLYGPVFFAVTAASLKLFGLSLASVRLVSVAGALLAAGSAAVLTRWLGGDRVRQWWAFTLIVLTPEVGYQATSARMDTLALGLSLLALATFVRGLGRASAPALHGVAAGALLAAAALCAPRCGPYVVIFITTALVWPLWAGPRRATAARQALWTAATLVLAVVGWAAYWFGSPIRWAAFLWFISTHYSDKIAVLPAAHRMWFAESWPVFTPAVALVGAATVVAAGRLANVPLTGPARFALVVSGVSAVVTAWVMNYAFTLGLYFAVCLLAVVVATFPRLGGRARWLPAALVLALLIGDLGLRGVRTARLAQTWAAGDPAPLDAFVRAHVPAGSLVFGPDLFYYYAVERAGAQYLLETALRGPEHWTALVQRGEATPLGTHQARYLLWPVDDRLAGPIPGPLACAGARVVARFDPPPHPSPHDWIVGIASVLPSTYEATDLWRLPSNCGGR